MSTESNAELRAQTGAIEGRMKVIDPLRSSGPSTRVQVVQRSDSEIGVRATQPVSIGSLIHLRTANRVLVGEVRDCTPADTGHEIRVLVKEVSMRSTQDLRRSADFPSTENRLHQRFPTNLDVVLTDIANPDHVGTGWIVDVSRTGIRARMPKRVDPGAMVKLEVADCALFGQAIRCSEDAGGYEIGVEIVRVLIGRSDLAQLVNTILAEAAPNTPGVRAGEATD
jgi:PilZ domain